MNPRSAIKTNLKTAAPDLASLRVRAGRRCGPNTGDHSKRTWEACSVRTVCTDRLKSDRGLEAPHFVKAFLRAQAAIGHCWQIITNCHLVAYGRISSDLPSLGLRIIGADRWRASRKRAYQAWQRGCRRWRSRFQGQRALRARRRSALQLTNDSPVARERSTTTASSCGA